MLDNTQSIICAFGLAAAAPRSPYRHLELCGIALSVYRITEAPQISMNLRRIPMVEVTGLEPAASWSQTTRATSCATPREHFYYICSRRVRQVLNLGDDEEEAAGAHNMHSCGLNKCKCFLLKQ